MRKILILAFLIMLSVNSAVFARIQPEKINGTTENDFILEQMLPNPNVFLYGKDTNGFPVLMMNFSSTIPNYTITDRTNLINFFIPCWRTKISSLKSVTTTLKIEPSDVPVGQNYYYKILKIKCKEVSQGIAHQDQNTFYAEATPQYNGVQVAKVSDEYITRKNYVSERPIITYSGIGSDSLIIMLKRGKKYRIPSGHIDVQMLVLAIPYYENPLTYNDLKNHCHDFIEEFMTFTEPDFSSKCEDKNCQKGKNKQNNCCKPLCKANNGNNLPIMRKIYFGKMYFDNRLNSFYSADRCDSHGLYLNSLVIPASRINRVPSTTMKTEIITTISAPATNNKTKKLTTSSKNDETATQIISCSSFDNIKHCVTTTKKVCKKKSKTCCKCDNTKEEKCETTIKIEETQELNNAILKDSQIMYDSVIDDQTMNAIPTQPRHDSPDLQPLAASH